MIPRAHIVGWRARAPWAEDAQVEQDLVLTRAVVELFGNATIAEKVALRGGTAHNKLFLARPARYSEDIDLVQVQGEPIGPLLEAIRSCLDPLLGRASHKKGDGVSNLVYRFDSEIEPVRQLRLKVEINTREHFTVFGHEKRTLTVDSPWFKGTSEVVTYSLEELLATKLRALFHEPEARKTRDLRTPRRSGARRRCRPSSSANQRTAGSSTTATR